MKIFKNKPSFEILIRIHARPCCSGLRFDNSESRKINKISREYRMVRTSGSELDSIGESDERTSLASCAVVAIASSDPVKR